MDHGAPLLGLSVVVGSARFLQLRADVVLVQLPQVAERELLGKVLQEHRRQMGQRKHTMSF